MEFIPARTILSKVKDGDKWFGLDYNVNMYKGCPHGCIYCDSRSNCYHVDDFDRPRGKENALQILERELSSKRTKGVVGLGAMSDTYNPQEKKYLQTRGALELFARYGFGLAVDTKSDLILRDIDLIKEIGRKNSAMVKITITTPKDELCRLTEPHVCPSSARFAAINKLSRNGIFAGVLMTPVLPFITDNEDDIRRLVQMSRDNGAKFVYTFMSVTLRENQRDYYYQQLDRLFPGMKEKYIRTYGNMYNCIAPDYRRLYYAFEDECNRQGLLYKMNDIIAAYKKEPVTDTQLSLFGL